ncbi:protein of unknown function [Tenacibaculum sp. 190524A02b]|uniref:hypothetical protein n=1 Tax=Tenacibaculum vairaonense TaxID=3137860 RepID=UPI0032B2AE22
MDGIEKAKETYKRWWVGKYCKVPGDYQYKKVIDVVVYGPRSFVYGGASLVFEDLSNRPIRTTAFKPRKKDILIKQ